MKLRFRLALQWVIRLRLTLSIDTLRRGLEGVSRSLQLPPVRIRKDVCFSSRGWRATVGAAARRGYKPAASSKPKIRAMTERTFSILKPDATARNLTGAINAVIEKAGLRIVAQKRIKMSRDDAEQFYAVHKARPFFGELVETMTSGPVVVQVLEGEGAIAKYREIMGATNPEQAAEGTIRKLYAKSIGENSVHGSDAPETAKVEIAQFFPDAEIVG
jgi:nucleoside-diphosphate kinase